MDLRIIGRLLEEAQWAAHSSPSSDISESNYCFKCGEFEPGPHKEDCELAAAINYIRSHCQ